MGAECAEFGGKSNRPMPVNRPFAIILKALFTFGNLSGGWAYCVIWSLNVNDKRLISPVTEVEQI